MHVLPGRHQQRGVLLDQTIRVDDVTWLHGVHLPDDGRSAADPEPNDHGRLATFEDVHMRWRVLPWRTVDADPEFAITNECGHRDNKPSVGFLQAPDDAARDRAIDAADPEH